MENFNENENVVKFTNSKRGKQQAIFGGYLYSFQKFSTSDPDLRFWQCINYAKGDENSCPSRLHTRGNQKVKILHEHNHDEDPALVEAKDIRNQMKARAENTVELPVQIKDNILRNTQATQPVVAKLGTDNSLRLMVERTRNRQNAVPPDPQNVFELEIPQKYQIFDPNTGERFLLFDSGAEQPDPHRILIFGRASIENWVNHIENIYVDGTFKIAPNLFGQLLMILGKRTIGNGNSYVLPLMYCLVHDKSRNTYERLFHQVTELFPGLVPLSAAHDFEIALFESIRASWPMAQLHGCFFHLNNSLKKKIREHQLYNSYKNNPEFKIHAKMIVALAFVPVNQIIQTFEQLKAATIGPFQPLNVIFNWFEQFYIGLPLRNGGRRSPIFPQEMWSVHERVLNGDDRTNNFSEAGHKRIQKSLSVEHPSIWKFINGIKTVQRGRDKAYEEMVMGVAPPKKRRIFVNTDSRILGIVRGGFEARTPLEYLRGIAHNFNMDQ